MNRFCLISFLCSIWVLAGCATTGGTIGGLFPAPKFLEGAIENDTYMAQDKSFSIKVPHKDESNEYTYMQVKEQYSEYGAYTSFGPAAFDQSIYRVETVKRITSGSQNVSFEDVAPKIVESYKEQLRKGYGTEPKEVSSSRESISGRKSFYWQLTQVVPEGKYINNRDAIFTHHVYVIDFETKGAAITWVQIPDTTTRAAMEPRAFAESVVMH